jgi:Arc/MetJ family transcription regulator
MRTNIIIDDDLMNRALEVSGEKTKRATVGKALALLISMKNREKIRALPSETAPPSDLPHHQPPAGYTPEGR